jgi:hypothetical protein
MLWSPATGSQTPPVNTERSDPDQPVRRYSEIPTIERVAVPNGGAARMLSKRLRLRNVVTNGSRPSPVLRPTLWQDACRGPGLQIGSSHPIPVERSCQAARHPSPTSWKAY